MLNEKFTFCFKIAIKWNPIKLYATRLKSAKYKSHVIKKRAIKVNELQRDESYGLS